MRLIGDLKVGNATVSNDRSDDHHHKEYVEKLNTDYDYNLIRYMSPEEVEEMFHSPFFDGVDHWTWEECTFIHLTMHLGLRRQQKNPA